MNAPKGTRRVSAPESSVKESIDKVEKPRTNSILYAPVDYKHNFIPRKIGGNYVDLTGLRAELMNHILSDESPAPILLIGDKGTGKTQLVHDIAYELYEKGICGGMNTMQGTYNTSDKHIIGYNRLRGLEGETVKGSAVNAIEGANLVADDGKLWIHYIDEFPNMANEPSLIYAPLLDGRREIQTQDGTIWKLNDNAKLVIIASGNPTHYSGVQTLQEALLSRFVGFHIGQTNEEGLREIIDFKQYGIEDDVSKPLLQLVIDIHNMRTRSDVDYSISTRDVILFCKDYHARLNMYTPKVTASQALQQSIEKCILFKFQTKQERDLIKTSINDTFGISMSTRFY